MFSNRGRLRDLEDHASRIEAGLVQLALDRAQHLGVAHRCAGQVDLDARRTRARVTMRRDGADRACDRHRVDLLDHPETLRGRQERAWFDQRAVVVAHAQQDLELRRGARSEVEDRLGDVDEAILVERDADPLGPGDPPVHARRRLLAADVQRELVASGLLGVVHREVGVDENVLAAQVVTRFEHRNADARGHRAFGGAGHGDPFGAQRLEQVAGDLLCRLGGGARQQRGELVAAEPRQDVARTQPAREDGRDARDDLVTGGMAERVVEVLEMVEVEQNERAVGAVTAHEVGVRFELGGEARAVVQAGERIVRREVVQVLLVVATMRDVLDLDEEAPRRAPVVLDRRRLQRDPDRRAAGMQEARLDRVVRARSRQQRPDAVAVVDRRRRGV